MFDNMRRMFVRATTVSSHQSVLDSAIGIQMINQVHGDYLEFGVFKGDRLIQAYETANFLTKRIRSGKDPYLSKASTSNLEAMRFFGFDSFQGLPKASAIDVAEGQETWIGEGGFSASLAEVTTLMPRKGLESNRIRLVKGWFNDTLNDATKQQHALKSASIVYVDCDYYESAVPALEFITDLLVDGSIVIVRRLVDLSRTLGPRRAARVLRMERAARHRGQGVHPGHGDVVHHPALTRRPASADPGATPPRGFCYGECRSGDPPASQRDSRLSGSCAARSYQYRQDAPRNRAHVGLRQRHDRAAAAPAGARGLRPCQRTHR
jgi:Macrocin-O-methyltransferase (TylF)